MANEFKTKLLNNSVSLDHKIRHQFIKNKFKNRSHIVTYDQNNTIHTYKTHNGKVFFKTCGKNNFNNLDVKLQDTSESLYVHRQKITNKQLNRISPTKVEIPSNNNCFGLYCNNLTCVRNFGTNNFSFTTDFITQVDRFDQYNYVNYPYIHLIRNYNYNIFRPKPSISGSTNSSEISIDVIRAYACANNQYGEKIKPYDVFLTMMSGSEDSTVVVNLNEMSLGLHFLSQLSDLERHFKTENPPSADYFGVFINNMGNVFENKLSDPYKPYPYFNYYDLTNTSTSPQYMYRLSPIIPYDPFNTYGYYKASYKYFGDPRDGLLINKLSDRTKWFLDYSYLTPMLNATYNIPELRYIINYNKAGFDETKYNTNSSLTYYFKNNIDIINSISEFYDYYKGFYTGGNAILNTQYRIMKKLYSEELNTMCKLSKNSRYKCDDFDFGSSTSYDFDDLMFQYNGYTESYGTKPNFMLYPCKNLSVDFGYGSLNAKDFYILNVDLRFQLLPSSTSNFGQSIGVIIKSKKERVFLNKYKKMLPKNLIFIGNDMRNIKIDKMKQEIDSKNVIVINDHLKNFICADERTYFDRTYETDEY
jgi:hypothetical protein